VFANTRRRALRAAIRERAEPVDLVDDLSRLHLAGDGEIITSSVAEEERLEDLVAWIRDRGRLRHETAELVVLTRVGGVSVDELAAITRVHPQTMRQQRLRAEQTLRHSLSLAR
jgi:DNA-directed RNA polymerase specialized sigma24 family protein